MAHNTIALVTALTPVIGYAQASAAAQEALDKNLPVTEVVLAQKLLTIDQLQNVLSPEALTTNAGRRPTLTRH
ncbi:hypothetical protein ACKI16_38965 [Streptomyces scabiei]|uniref:hypothetical protein n=1 Tax=Streptomyces scabiei TaxID=1930 RepID=UPI0038F75E45